MSVLSTHSQSRGILWPSRTEVHTPSVFGSPVFSVEPNLIHYHFSQISILATCMCWGSFCSVTKQPLCTRPCTWVFGCKDEWNAVSAPYWLEQRVGPNTMVVISTEQGRYWPPAGVGQCRTAKRALCLLGLLRGRLCGWQHTRAASGERTWSYLSLVIIMS